MSVKPASGRVERRLGDGQSLGSAEVARHGDPPAAARAGSRTPAMVDPCPCLPGIANADVVPAWLLADRRVRR